MPLEKNKSNAARQRNIEREIAAGKDPSQAVAIGYAVQRRAGGAVGTRKYGQSELDTRMNEAAKKGGGIQPGAHPEFDQPTPLDKTVAAVKNVSKKVADVFGYNNRSKAGKLHR